MATIPRTEPKKAPPVHKINISPITVSIWANKNNNTGEKFHTVTWTRTYKDGDEFKHTSSVHKGNISNLIAALKLAEEWLKINDE